MEFLFIFGVLPLVVPVVISVCVGYIKELTQSEFIVGVSDMTLWHGMSSVVGSLLVFSPSSLVVEVILVS